jgi:hypothetical protein
MSEEKLLLVLDKVKEIVGNEIYEAEFQPILACTKEQVLALLLKDMKLSISLTKASNKELAEMITNELWSQLPINSEAALLLSEVIERLKHPIFNAIGGLRR